MNRQILSFMAIAIVFLSSCTPKETRQMSDVDIWKLGWRMIESSMDEKYEIANAQFDSIWNARENMDLKYLITGLEVKNILKKDDEIAEILAVQKEETLEDLCAKRILSKFEICGDYSIEKVENEELQMELIKMYVNDQYVRSNLMTELLDKYNLSQTEVIVDSFGIRTDERNRERLKEIIEENGFPTKKLVGEDAMQGVFLMIQHSDGDKEWQKSQLINIEKAVKRGDMDGQSYAYLYDRIKINGGTKQWYGTQFAKVDPINKVVELAETEDIENLDKRRMEVGLMPIEMYKKIMLKNL